jgi:glycosyltransferase involved in cell wall biosynthesis
MPTKPPIVSVLVTVYNREVFLEATLLSILASLFVDFEVIVVDDCSVDKSRNIAAKVAEGDSRVTLHVNSTNLGDYGNRMRAASMARGKYLKYVDSDDIIYPHSLGVMVDAMEQNDGVSLALSHSLPEDEQPYPWVLSPRDCFRKHFMGRGCLGCGPSGAIIRRSSFESVGGFRQEWGVLSDVELWLRLASRWPTALLPPGLIWWRRHEGQEFSRSGASLTYLERGFELAIQSLRDSSCPLSEAEKGSVLARVRHVHARRLLSLALKGRNPQTAWRLFRKSDLTCLDLLGGFRSYQPVFASHD